MTKRKLEVAIIILLTALFFVSGCGNAAEEAKKDEIALYQVDESIDAPDWTDTYVAGEKEAGDLRIIQISDPHYYSLSITDQGNLYQSAMAKAAGRDALHIGEILDAFYDQMQCLQPDILIVSGDLSMNGEKASHQDFANYLSRFEENGISVLVIPGNHDINSTSAKAIYDTGAIETENVTPEEFEDIYKQFGYADAIYKDAGSLSYVADAGKNCWIIMLDASIYRDRIIKQSGYLSSDTRQWVYDIIDEANEKGVRVITVTHQNLLVHNENFISDFTVVDGASFVENLMKKGVAINLSGHMHCMNIIDRKEKFYEVAMESISVWPNLYGQLDISEDNIYEFSTHATEHEGNSYAYMLDSTDRTLGNRVPQFDIPQEQLDQMRQFVVKMNVDYFAGKTMTEEEYLQEEGYKLWQEYAPDSVNGEYINSIVHQKRNDHTYILPFKVEKVEQKD